MLCTPTSAGSVCLPVSAASASPITCVAPQILLGSPPGPASDPGCRNPVVESALSPADVQHLGIHSPGDQVSFNVPARATGFSIVSQAVSTNTSLVDCPGEVIANVPVPSPLLTPGDKIFFDITAKGPQDPTMASLASFVIAGQPPYTAALTFPNTTAGLNLALDGGLPGGEWKFEFNDFANELGCYVPSEPNTYDVTAVVSPGPLPPTGEIAVDLYLVTNGLDAGSAMKAAGLQAFVSRYASLFAQAGVCLSTVTLHDVPSWALDKYSSVDVDYDVVQDPCSDFRQMFTLAEAGRSMALFLVDDMVLANGHTTGIIGFDGAIPGNATFNGTIAGGAAVLGTDLLSTSGCTAEYQPTICGPDLVAGVSAHETGHFLGLVHPTEQTGNVFDPLKDTASCVCALCETDPSAAAACSYNPDGGQPTFVDSSVCSSATQLCGGANLLMFWTVSTKGEITVEQAAVIRANPLISAP